MFKKMILWLIVGSGIFYTCQRKNVCPAYNSSFILDDTKTRSFFSQFGQDTVPKGQMTVNKNKSGIIVKVKYQQKQKELNSIKMKMTYPPPDSTLYADIDLSHLSEEEKDSVYAMAPMQRVSYKRDQEIYMRYIGSHYQRSDSDATRPPQEKVDAVVEEEKEKKKKRWFWSRNKKADEPSPDEQEEEIIAF